MADALHRPAHKLICSSGEKSVLKLVKHFIANRFLNFNLQAYCALALDLLNVPTGTEIQQSIRVNVSLMPCELAAYLQAKLNGGDVKQMQYMLHIGKVMAGDFELNIGAKRILHETRMDAETNRPGTNFHVIMANFTGDGMTSIFYPMVIAPEALRFSREAPPFVRKSAILGEFEVPFNMESILE